MLADTKMWLQFLPSLLLLLTAAAQAASFCPEKDVISPCECTRDYENASVSVYCSGSHMSAAEMTAIVGRLQNTTMSRLQIIGFADLTEIPAGMFSDLEIFSLTIRSSSRPTMNAQSFAGIRGLIELILTSLGMTEQPSVIFPSVSHVEFLDLSYNRFTTLPERIFSPFRQLLRLFLQFGSLTTIAPNALGGLSTLEYLDLSHNKSGFIKPGLFAEMGQLYTMMLK
ncbi:PREDICTED: leucine-rich repeat transmembrane neuronal protein 4-like [Priapulus caudatus]|uniref:Leucine-rich repeat transmembrane neuronal protein 4-like n=1 Tax=Priapulus caudatus TaxID=37621 RepID=A0ABM1DUL6_PRICU|nr:PREDICTED: leucine-rich repeat transmembrane neuronal protein 4-like [Priapulus caudatus]